MNDTPKDQEIKAIADKIVKGAAPSRIILFGSRAENKGNVNSDVDLCVIQDNIKDKSDEFIKIRRLLGDVIYPLDIIILNRDEYEKRKDIFGTVQYEIDKKGKVLYERRG
ncbi:MAG: nucleotidyltransferase domain-containing protein [Candidatus Margulisiibacteriota bacterium]